MPAYDALHYDPPAPVASVTLRLPNATSISGVYLLIDTGADITLLPRSAIDRLGITLDPSLVYELTGFDGNRTSAQAVDIDMVFLQRIFKGRYLLTEAEHGILGRDILSRLDMLLKGPAMEWLEVTPGR